MKLQGTKAVFFIAFAWLVVACGGSGGGGSSARAPLPPAASPCPTGQILVSGRCQDITQTAPPSCPGDQIISGNRCICPTGQALVDNRCQIVQTQACPSSEYFQDGVCRRFNFAITHFYERIGQLLPCGVRSLNYRGLLADNADFVSCARSFIPGLTQLSSEVEKKTTRIRTGGGSVEKIHTHIDNFSSRANPGLETHGRASASVIRQIGGFDLLQEIQGVDPLITSVLYPDIKRVVSFGSGNVLNANVPERTDLSSRNRFLILGSGNNGVSDVRTDTNGQGTVENISTHIRVGTHFLLVAGYNVSDVIPMTNRDGRHIRFVPYTQWDRLRDTGIEGIDPSPAGASINLHPSSSPCTTVAMNHCVVAPWFTVLEEDLDGRNRIFAGTSNALLYVSSSIAQMLYIWPNLTNDQVMSIVRDTSIDLGDPGPDKIYGLGLLSVQGLFSPSGDLIDPRTLITTRGFVSLPFDVDIVGIDRYERDFNLSFQKSINSYVPVQSLKRGIYPFITEDGKARKGIMLKDRNFFTSIHLEEEGFLGGYGTDSYRLGDTTWITLGLERSFSFINIKSSVTHGDMDRRDNSLIQDIKATFGSVSVFGSQPLGRIEMNYNLDYTTPVLFDYNIQGDKEHRTDYDVKLELSFELNF